MEKWIKWEDSKPSDGAVIVCLGTEGTLWLDCWSEESLSNPEYANLTPNLYYELPLPEPT